MRASILLALAGAATAGAQSGDSAAGGMLYCWGGGSDTGRLGAGGTGPPVDSPAYQAVAGNKAWQQLVAGNGLTCGIDSFGDAYCFGDGSNGALGFGGVGTRLTPAPVFPSGQGTLAQRPTHPAFIPGSITVSKSADAIAFSSSYTPSTPVGADSNDDFSYTYDPISTPPGPHGCAISGTKQAWCWGFIPSFAASSLMTTMKSPFARVPVAAPTPSAPTTAQLDAAWSVYAAGGSVSFSTPNFTSSTATVNGWVSISAGDGFTCGIADISLQPSPFVSLMGRRMLGESGGSSSSSSLRGGLSNAETAVARQLQGNSTGGSSSNSTNGTASSPSPSPAGDVSPSPSSDVPASSSSSPSPVSNSTGGGRGGSGSNSTTNSTAASSTPSAAAPASPSRSPVAPSPSSSVTPSPMPSPSATPSVSVSVTPSPSPQPPIPPMPNGFCWGASGPGKGQTKPSPVPGSHSFVQISAGHAHACGIDTQSRAWCWGKGANGRLGNNDTKDSDTPVRVFGAYTWKYISAGYEHTCGIINGLEAVLCWGSAARYRLGIYQAVNDLLIPTSISSNYRFTEVQVGVNHTCAVATDGLVYCFGDNPDGRMGCYSLSGIPCSSQVGKRWGWRNITVGARHTCAIANDMLQGFCWGGSASKGALGYGTQGYTTAVRPESPTRVALLPTLPNGYPLAWAPMANDVVTGDQKLDSSSPFSGSLAAFSAGSGQTCGISNNGSAFCWGSRASGLGDGVNNPYASDVFAAGVSAVRVPRAGMGGDAKWAAIAAGTDHSCGITAESGKLACWGTFVDAPAGYNGTAVYPAPTPMPLPQAVNGVAFDGRWKSVTSGSGFSCGVQSNGVGFCWGREAVKGQLASAQAAAIAAATKGNASADLLGVATRMWMLPVLDEVAFPSPTPSPAAASAPPSTSPSPAPASASSTPSADVAPASSTPSPSSSSLGGSNSTNSSSGSSGSGSGSGSGSNSTQAGGNSTRRLLLEEDSEGVFGRRLSTNDTNSTGNSTNATASSSPSPAAAASVTPSPLAGNSTGNTTNDTNTTASSSPSPAAARASPSPVEGNSTTGTNSTGGSNATAASASPSPVEQLPPTPTPSSSTVPSATSSPIAPSPSSTPAPVGVSWSEVSAGAAHACGRATNGSVWCWGEGSWGALGRGAGSKSDSPAPALVLSPPAAYSAISSGERFTCGIALPDTTDVYCWGWGGLLGRNSVLFTSIPRASSPAAFQPTLVTSLSGALGTGEIWTTLTAGATHACALSSGGRLVCFGDGSEGQLGGGSVANSSSGVVNVPVPQSAISGAAAYGYTGTLKWLAAEAGSIHTCAVLSIPAPTPTATATATPSSTNTGTGTSTGTSTMTRTPSRSFSSTRTMTATPSIIASGASQSRTPTRTPTSSVTPSPSPAPEPFFGASLALSGVSGDAVVADPAPVVAAFANTVAALVQVPATDVFVSTISNATTGEVYYNASADGSRLRRLGRVAAAAAEEEVEKKGAQRGMMMMRRLQVTSGLLFDIIVRTAAIIPSSSSGGTSTSRQFNENAAQTLAGYLDGSVPLPPTVQAALTTLNNGTAATTIFVAIANAVGADPATLAAAIDVNSIVTEPIYVPNVAVSSTPTPSTSFSPTAYAAIATYGDPNKINGFFIAGYIAAGIGAICLLGMVFLCLQMACCSCCGRKAALSKDDAAAFEHKKGGPIVLDGSSVSVTGRAAKKGRKSDGVVLSSTSATDNTSKIDDANFAIANPLRGGGGGAGAVGARASAPSFVKGGPSAAAAQGMAGMTAGPAANPQFVVSGGGMGAGGYGGGGSVGQQTTTHIVIPS